MKRFNLGVVKGIINSRSGDKSSSKDAEVHETLKPHDFYCGKLMRHGFPFHPTCMAWDPIQKLLAIGTKHGIIRLLGRAGVDISMQHESTDGGGVPIILQVAFLINEGALITVCSDHRVHLWNFRQKIPEIVHTLKFSREQITCLHLPYQSKWLYLGSERGNVHVVNIESFTVCGYTIQWNKAIELARKTHPGPVVHLSDNPLDHNRLLIGFETGLVVLWDLRCKMAEFRFHCSESLRDACWHHDGKQFMCSHADGTITVWNYKQQSRPVSTLSPHAKTGKNGKTSPCKPINRVDWKSMKNESLDLGPLSQLSEPYIIFSGGQSYDRSSKSPSITLQHGKSVTVLEMEHQIIDFKVLCNNIWAHDAQDPYAIIVLLSSDLVFIDLTSPGWVDNRLTDILLVTHSSSLLTTVKTEFISVNQHLMHCFPFHCFPLGKFVDGIDVSQDIDENVKLSMEFNGGKMTQCHNFFNIRYPCFQCPYAIDIHESPVTCVKYYSDCASDLIPAFYSCGTKQKRKGFSEKEFPVLGGQWGSASTSYSELLVTGHADGSLKFWDVSGINLQYLYKLKSAKMFERPKHKDDEEDVFAIQHMYLDEESRILAVSGTQHIVLFSFNKKDSSIDVPLVEVTAIHDVFEEVDSPEDENTVQPRSTPAANLTQEAKEMHTSVKSKTGPRKWAAGYQPDLVCVLNWCEGDTPPVLTCLCVNSSYGLMAAGTTSSVFVIDIAQKVCLLNVLPADLQGSHMSRSIQPAVTPHSPKLRRAVDEAMAGKEENGSRTPSIDQPPSAPERDEGEAPPRPVVGPGGAQLAKRKSRSTSAVDQLDINSSHDNESGDETVGRKTSLPKANSAVPITGKDSQPHDNDKSPGVFNRMARRLSVKVGLNSINRQQKSVRSERQAQTAAASTNAVFFADQKKTEAEGSSRMARLKLTDRSDGAFSHSRSSSLNSLDATGPSDIVQFVMFADGYTKKSDQGKTSWARAAQIALAKTRHGMPPSGILANDTTPGLWLGTNNGTVIVMNVNLPGSERTSQPVIVNNSGTVFQLKGSVMEIAFLDYNGLLVPVEAEVWSDGRDTDKREKRLVSRMSRTRSTSEPYSRADSTGGENLSSGRNRRHSGLVSRLSRSSMAATESQERANNDKHIVVIGTDSEIRSIALPSQSVLFKEKYPENMFAVKSEVVIVKDSVCFACLSSIGNIMVYSLPSLRSLLNVNVISQFDVRVARTLDFGNHGHAVYMCTATEIQKVTVSADMCRSMSDMKCEPFVARESPEPPKQSFLKNLFSSGPSSLDRQELFGTAGKASHGVATHIPGTAMQQAHANATGLAGDLARTRIALDQRGENLSRLEDKTEELKNKAKEFQLNASHLASKYRDAKWYQL